MRGEGTPRGCRGSIPRLTRLPPLLRPPLPPGYIRGPEPHNRQQTRASSSVNSIVPRNTKPKPEMARIAFVCCLVLFAALLVLDLPNFAEATYRKPPFNGSIFGKRGTASVYEANEKALSSFCELASETCAGWFPFQERK